MEQRKIEYTIVQLDSLEPHPKNVRQGDIGAISESLKAHGQYRPIVVDRRTNRILAGNHTWKAAKALGWQQISAGFIETKDDDEALRILLADNKANDLATYDDTELINLLKDLAATDEGLEGTLFDTDELDALIEEHGHFELPADVDEISDNVPAKSKLGDIWLLDDHRLMCGDSYDIANLNQLMNQKQADCILTDPPYGINLNTDYSYHPNKGRTYRPVKGDDQGYNASSHRQYFSKVKQQFWFGANYYRRSLSENDMDGSWLVWDKRRPDTDAVMGSGFELIWSAQPHKQDLLRHMWHGFLSKNNEGHQRQHPTEKPITLLVEILNRWTETKSLIVDLFAGSGSTLIAAMNSNRICYTIEFDPHYCDIICARYQKQTGKQPILEATGEPHNFNADTSPLP